MQLYEFVRFVLSVAVYQAASDTYTKRNPLYFGGTLPNINSICAARLEWMRKLWILRGQTNRTGPTGV